MKRILFAVFLFASNLHIESAHATAQQSDILIVDGEQQALYVNPMEKWFRDNPENAPSSPRKDGETICISSGNWRGYVATFALENAQLMLKKIETLGCGDREGGDILPTLFDGKKEVFVDWFSGILAVPIGEPIHYVHLGYGSLYSEYRLFRIEAGRMIDETRMNAEQYDAYRQRQFEAHKQTSRYVQDLAELMKDGQDDQDYADSFLYSVDTEYTTEIMLPFKAIPAP